MKKRRHKGGGRRFIQLYHNVKRSRAYHELSVYARAALIELLERYNGANNGMIGLGCRELSGALACSRDRAAQALRELDDSGLARPITGGVWRGKKATEWRLTFFRCDKTCELPILNWEPHSQSARNDTKVRVEGHKAVLSPTGRTQEPKNPINNSPLSPPGRTHIDLYPVDSDVVGGAETIPRQPSEQSLGGVGASLKTEDPRIAALLARQLAALPSAWTKPTIISDEPRSPGEFPLVEAA